MNRTCPLRRGLPTLTALLLVLLVPGCGGDDPTTPVPDPEISLSLECVGGLIELTVRNSGGPTAEPDLLVAAYADGQSDTLRLDLGADELLTCLLSNVHGGVTVTDETRDITASADDGLADYFAGLMASVDLGGLIPSPITRWTVVTCEYPIYLRNFAYDHSTFALLRTDDGLTLRTVYSGITGDLSAASPEWLCPDLTGSIAIASITVETRIDIGDGDDPQVTLGGTEATVNGLQINVDGTFGFIVGWITNWFQDTFVTAMADAIESVISYQVGADLSELVIVQSSCAGGD